MRSLSGSSITTFLMFVPLLAVPLLAIFGIPEFSPVNASPADGDNRVLQVSDREPAGSRSEKHSPDDLYADVEERTEFASDFKRLNIERPADPFQSNRGASSPAMRGAAKSGVDGSTPTKNRRLGGWTVDANRRKTTEASKTQSPLPERQPIDAASRSRERSPFAKESAQNSQPASSGRNRPKSFAEYAQSREKADVTQHAARSRGLRTPVDRSGSGSSLLNVPPETSRGKQASNQTSPSGPLTWRSASDRLNSLGIRDFRLERGRRSGEFHFSCTFIPNQGARISIRFEAEDTEPLQAVQNVIAQIESWLRRR